MADIFDSLGRKIGESLDNIKGEINRLSSSITKSSESNEKLYEVIEKLNKTIQNTKKENQNIKENSEVLSKTVSFEKSDIAEFQRVGKLIQDAAKRNEEPRENLSFIEKAVNSLSNSIEKIPFASMSDYLQKSTDRIVDAITGTTLSVKDKTLAIIANKILVSNKKTKSTEPKKNNQLSNFDEFAKKNIDLAEAGLEKGSIYTHDYTAEVLLDVIATYQKSILEVLNNIASKQGASAVADIDPKNLISKTFESLMKDKTPSSSSSSPPPKKKSTFGSTDELTTIAELIFSRGIESQRGRLRQDDVSDKIADELKNLKLSDEEIEKLEEILEQAYFLNETQRKEIKSLSWDIIKGLREGKPEEYNRALSDLRNGIDRWFHMLEKQEKVRKWNDEIQSNRLKLFADDLTSWGERYIKPFSDALNTFKPSEFGFGPGLKMENPFEAIKETSKEYSKEMSEMGKQMFASFGVTGPNISKEISDVSMAKGFADMLGTSIMGVVQSGYDATFGEPERITQVKETLPRQKLREAEGKSISQRDFSALYLDAVSNRLEILKQTGVDQEKAFGAMVSNMQRGIKQFNTMNRVSKIGLGLSTVIKSNAESTASEFADWNQFLGLSTDELESVAKSTILISQTVGVTGDNLLDAVKNAKKFAEEMRNAGFLTTKASKNLIQLSASAKKLGVESQVGRIQSGITSAVGLFFEADAQVQALAANAAASVGLIQDLQQGTLFSDQDKLKSFTGGLEDMFQKLSGGISSQNIEVLSKTDPQLLALINMQMKAATGLQASEFARVIKSFEEAGLTVEDRINKIDIRLTKTLTNTERTLLLTEKDALLETKKQEDFNKKLEKGATFIKDLSNVELQDREGQLNVIKQSFGTESGALEYLNTLSDDIGKILTSEVPKLKEIDANDPLKAEAYRMELEQFNKSKDILASAKRSLDEYAEKVKKGEETLDPQKMATLVENVKDAQGSMSEVSTALNNLDSATQLESTQRKLNAEFQTEIRDNVAKIVDNTSMLMRLQLLATMTTGITALIANFSSFAGTSAGMWQAIKGIGQGIVDLPKTIGGIFSSIKNFPATALGFIKNQGIFFASKFKEFFSNFTSLFGFSSIKNAPLIKPAGFGYPSAITGGAAATTGIGGAGKFLGGATKFLSKALLPLAAIHGVYSGITEAKESGRGSFAGGTFGLLTGGADTGSMLSSLVGAEKGGTTDTLLGIGGASARGALMGGGIGAMFGGVGAAPGAAIGAIVGGIAELVKVLTSEKGGKIGRFISGVASSIWNFGKKIYEVFGAKGIGMLIAGPFGLFAGAIIDLAGRVDFAKIGEQISYLSNSVYGFAKNIYDNYISGFVSEAIKSTEKLYGIAKKFLIPMFNVLGKLGGKLWDSLIPKTEKMANSIKNIFNVTYKAISWVADSWIGRRIQANLVDPIIKMGELIGDMAVVMYDDYIDPLIKWTNYLIEIADKLKEADIEKMFKKLLDPFGIIDTPVEQPIVNANQQVLENEQKGFWGGFWDGFTNPFGDEQRGNGRIVVPNQRLEQEKPLADQYFGDQNNLLSSRTNEDLLADKYFGDRNQTLVSTSAPASPTEFAGKSNTVENATTAVMASKVSNENVYKAVEDGNGRLGDIESNTGETVKEISLMRKKINELIEIMSERSSGGGVNKVALKPIPNYYRFNSNEGLSGIGNTNSSNV